MGEAAFEGEPLELPLERIWNQASDLVSGACDERKVPFGGGLYFSSFGLGATTSFALCFFGKGAGSNPVDHSLFLSKARWFAVDLLVVFFADFRLARLDADDALELLLDRLEREDPGDEEEPRLERGLRGRGIMPPSPPRASATSRTLSAMLTGESFGRGRKR